MSQRSDEEPGSAERKHGWGSGDFDCRCLLAFWLSLLTGTLTRNLQSGIFNHPHYLNCHNVFDFAVFFQPCLFSCSFSGLPGKITVQYSCFPFPVFWSNFIYWTILVLPLGVNMNLFFPKWSKLPRSTFLYEVMDKYSVLRDQFSSVDFPIMQRFSSFLLFVWYSWGYLVSFQHSLPPVLSIVMVWGALVFHWYTKHNINGQSWSMAKQEIIGCKPCFLTFCTVVHIHNLCKWRLLVSFDSLR